MKNLLTRLRIPLRRFGRDQNGTIVAEAVIVLPLFLWSYIALFVYWDSFRSLNTVQKAAYTISDMLSREQINVTQGYIDGMGDLLEYLIDRNQDADLRVTSIYWSDTNEQFEVLWSASPESALAPLTNGSLQDLANEIPAMAPGSSAIIVEVSVDYVPGFDIGMPDQTFRQFIVTRPRFPPCITLIPISPDCSFGS